MAAALRPRAERQPARVDVAQPTVHVHQACPVQMLVPRESPRRPIDTPESSSRTRRCGRSSPTSGRRPAPSPTLHSLFLRNHARSGRAGTSPAPPASPRPSPRPPSPSAGPSSGRTRASSPPRCRRSPFRCCRARPSPRTSPASASSPSSGRKRREIAARVVAALHLQLRRIGRRRRTAQAVVGVARDERLGRAAVPNARRRPLQPPVRVVLVRLGECRPTIAAAREPAP